MRPCNRSRTPPPPLTGSRKTGHRDCEICGKIRSDETEVMSRLGKTAQKAICLSMTLNPLKMPSRSSFDNTKPLPTEPLRPSLTRLQFGRRTITSRDPFPQIQTPGRRRRITTATSSITLAHPKIRLSSTSMSVRISETSPSSKNACVGCLILKGRLPTFLSNAS
jgi:hypothetical protein